MSSPVSLSNHKRVTGLTTDSDGWIYAVTSRDWTQGSHLTADLYRINPDDLSYTHLKTLWPGPNRHEAWNVEYNVIDDSLYGTVSYNMTARLFRYDIETNTLEDLEEIAEGTNDAYSYQLGIASDGKVYIAVNNYVLRMYDPLNAGQGIIDAGVGYRPITFGADGKLYAVFGTQLLRNDILYQGYAISGVTHDPQQLPVAGVVLKTSEGHIAVSQANGQYAFTGLNSGIYTITEAALSYHTIPFSRVVQLPPSLVQQDFVVRQIPEPFLDLPVSYDSFAQAAKGTSLVEDLWKSQCLV